VWVSRKGDARIRKARKQNTRNENNNMSKSDGAHESGIVSLANEEAVKQVLTNSVLGLWEVVNNLTRLRPSKNDRYRVTIFGSARARPGTLAYEETKRTAAALAEMGCDIVTGGSRD